MGKGTKKGEELDLDSMVPVYVPSLFDLLLTAEKKKGAPLTSDEVVGIRDSATVVMMHRSRAVEVARTRVVVDLDPDNAWEEWKKRRAAGEE